MSAGIAYQPFCNECSWSPFGYADEQSAFAVMRDHDFEQHTPEDEGEDG